MQKSVVILGATGLVGSALLEELIQDPQVSEIRLLTRRPLVAQHAKVQIVETDLSDPNVVAFNGVRALYCCIGTTRKKTPNQTHYRAIDYGMTLAAAKAAKNAGATEVHLVSAIGADTQSKIFYSRLKGEIERDLLKLNFERTLIYQPSILIGPRPEKRFGEKIGQILSPIFDLLLFGSLQKYHSISAKKLACCMQRHSFQDQKGAQILVYPDLIKN
ncbi:MAG: hypothetical protein RI948_1504 [Bacteroidota bacterium]|jgi:uncharacterized protein YbjT (DUF2867 family)